MFILSSGLTRTGVSNLIGKQVLRFAGGGTGRLVSILMILTAMLSAFMNNIGVAAMFLPITLEIAHRIKRPASHLLLPLAYGSLLGGLILLISTASNLLVRDALLGYGAMDRFELIARDRDFVVLKSEIQEPLNTKKAPLASIIMLGVVLRSLCWL